MKKSLVYLLTATALVMTGCGAKSEGMDPTAGQKTEQKADTAVPEKAETAAPVEEKVEEAATAEETTDAGAALQEMVVYFDFDKFNIRDDMKATVEGIAEKIKASHVAGTIKVEGNCDEWGTDEYNYALGLKRAKSVKDTLAGYGVNADNLKLISYGESNPVCNEKTQECWQKNRRVEFKIAQ